MKNEQNIFNITIPYHNADISLTVMAEDDTFTLIYNGGIIGGLAKKENDWTWIEEEHYSAGPLPLLSQKKGYLDEQLTLGLPDVNHIADAITKALNKAA